MSSQTFSTFSEVGMIDARLRSGTITLPLTTTIPYRILTLKDIYGATGLSTTTIQTTSPDVFEDGTSTRLLNTAFQSLTVYAGQPGKWMLTATSLSNATTIGTLNISTLNVSSSVNFISGSQFTSTVQGLGSAGYVSTSYLASQLTSTIRGLGTAGYISSMASVSAATIFVSSIASATLSTGSLTTNALQVYSYINMTGGSLSNIATEYFTTPRFTTTFSPTSISGLKEWFDASQTASILSNGSGQVYQWNNLATGYANATQATTATQPYTGTATINGLNVMYYPGATFMLTGSITYSSQYRSLFQVVKVTTALGGATYAFYGGTGVNVYNVYYPDFEVNNVPGGTRIATINSPPSNIYQVPYLYDVYTGSAANGFFINGSNYGATTVFPTGTFTDAIGSNFAFGGSVGGTQPWYLCETIQYDADLTVAQRQTVEGYLAWKWGFQTSLVATHPYYSTPPPPTGTTYIAAGSIGADANSNVAIQPVATSKISLAGNTQVTGLFTASTISISSITGIYGNISTLSTQALTVSSINGVSLTRAFTSTVVGLGQAGYVSSQQLLSTSLGLANYINTFIDPPELASTVTGLGSAGYVSTTQLLSTSLGLRNFMEAFIDPTELTSTVTGLGSAGYVSTTQLLSTSLGLTNYINTFIDPPELASTVTGLGSAGYVSTTQLLSTSLGLRNYIDAFIDPNELTSTVIGLGTGGFVSTLGLTYSLASTVTGLGTLGYVSTSQLLSTTVGTYQAITAATNVITGTNLTSTVAGLGTAGYISSPQLLSTSLGIVNYISTFSVDHPELASTVTGLGTLGYISSPQLLSTSAGLVNPRQLVSTVQGLGTAGYISSPQLLSTSLGIVNYISTFSVDHPELASTVTGLGTLGYVSSPQLLSTSAGLVNPRQLVSTVQGLGTAGYASTTFVGAALSSFSTTLSRGFFTSTFATSSINANTGFISSLTVNTLFIGSNTGFTNLGDAITTSISSLVIYTGQQYATNTFTSSLNTSSLLSYSNATALFSSQQIVTSSLGVGIARPFRRLEVLSSMRIHDGALQTPTLEFTRNATQGQAFGASASADWVFAVSTGAFPNMNMYASYTGTRTNNLTLGHTGNVGINCNAPQYQLDVNGTIRTAGLAFAASMSTQSIVVSSINGVDFTRVFTSTVQGLGQAGYVSTTQLLSTSAGLVNPLQLTSTVAGLGSAGYVSSTQLLSTSAGLINPRQLTSTVAGLGQSGYVSSTQLLSTSLGLLTFINSFIDPTELTSTVIGLGTGGFVSTLGLTYSLASTVTGLGTLGYISTSQLLSTTVGTYNAITAATNVITGTNLTSTVAGLGSAGYVSTANLAGHVSTANLAGLVSTTYLTTQLASTVQGLGTAGYVSTTQLLSTSAGLASLAASGITQTQVTSSINNLLVPYSTLNTATYFQVKASTNQLYFGGYGSTAQVYMGDLLAASGNTVTTNPLLLMEQLPIPPPIFSPTTVTYTTPTSGTTWQVPANVTSLSIIIKGAGGGGGSGGIGGVGGYLSGTLAVTPGTIYTLIVGAGGTSTAGSGSIGGGGAGGAGGQQCSGGGGRSALQIGGLDIVTAGGGGGGGINTTYGGSGGGTTADSGTAYPGHNVTGGGGASGANGGSGGTGSVGGGNSGSLGQGGGGAGAGGGGGGGGWYGGGQGGYGSSTGGGGGGNSLASNLTTVISNTVGGGGAAGNYSAGGNGSISITYTPVVSASYRPGNILEVRNYQLNKFIIDPLLNVGINVSSITSGNQLDVNGVSRAVTLSTQQLNVSSINGTFAWQSNFLQSTVGGIYTTMNNIVIPYSSFNTSTNFQLKALSTQLYFGGFGSTSQIYIGDVLNATGNSIPTNPLLLMEQLSITGAPAGSSNYSATGSDQSFVVPSGVTSVNVVLNGAGGGGAGLNTATGGRGGYVSGTFAVTPGETLTIIVGTQGLQPTNGGYGGGGNAGNSYLTYSSGGGGRTAIQRSGLDVVTAGGGGGGGNGVNQAGGNGGGTTGVTAGINGQVGGSGGTQLAGGAGQGGGANGSLGTGGAGAAGGYNGGGGGGYYGGGGGGSSGTGGGGGSSYVSNLTGTVVNTQGGGAAQNTAGSMSISWSDAPPGYRPGNILEIRNYLTNKVIVDPLLNVGINVSSINTSFALDVNGPFRSAVFYSTITAGGTMTITPGGNFGVYYNITASGTYTISLASTQPSQNIGKYYVFRNNSGSSLSITITGGSGITSPITVATATTATIMVATTSTYALF